MQNNFEKVVMPLVERPFIPQEIEKLSDLKRKSIYYQDPYQKASIIGEDPNYQPGAVENPSIYTDVFKGHKTNVLKPIPQARIRPVGNKETGFIFTSEGSQQTGDTLLDDQISKGVSVGVKIGSFGPTSPTLKGYEQPHVKRSDHASGSEASFIEKKAGKEGESASTEKVKEPEEVVEGDIKTFLRQFENVKDKEDRIKVLVDGKAKLESEALELKDAISQDLSDLMDAKKLAIRLNNLIQKYEKKAAKDSSENQLRLADEITIKDLLKDKLHRELQGFRVSPTEYEELKQADPQVLDEISLAVNKKLGIY